jgi:hypothetical protein
MQNKDYRNLSEEKEEEIVVGIPVSMPQGTGQCPQQILLRPQGLGTIPYQNAPVPLMEMPRMPPPEPASVQSLSPFQGQ